MTTDLFPAGWLTTVGGYAVAAVRELYALYRERSSKAEAKATTDQLRAERDAWQGRWELEVKRNAALYHATPPADVTEPPPSPDWEEKTGVRHERAELERDALLRRFIESTPPGSLPPRKRMPSRRD